MSNPESNAGASSKVPPKRQSLKELMAQGGGFSGFRWPDHISDFDMRIASDGCWYYEGSKIERLALCKLFATVLQKDEDGNYWLVTPAERGRVVVEDAPFVVVEMKCAEETGRQVISFRTNLEHWITLDADHALRVDVNLETGEPRPYVRIRDGLDALISRSVFYELVEMTVEDDESKALGVWSSDIFFKLGEMGNS